MADIQRNYKMHAYHTDRIEKTTITKQKINGQLKHPYNELRKKYCKTNNITVREFEQQFERTNVYTYVKYAEKPWDTVQELISDLKQIQGVISVTDLTPRVRCHGTPKVRLYSELDTETLNERIKTYFDGLEVKQSKHGHLIFYSPIYHEKQKSRTSAEQQIQLNE